MGRFVVLAPFSTSCALDASLVPKKKESRLAAETLDCESKFLQSEEDRINPVRVVVAVVLVLLFNVN